MLVTDDSNIWLLAFNRADMRPSGFPAALFKQKPVCTSLVSPRRLQTHPSPRWEIDPLWILFQKSFGCPAFRAPARRWSCGCLTVDTLAQCNGVKKEREAVSLLALQQQLLVTLFTVFFSSARRAFRRPRWLSGLTALRAPPSGRRPAAGRRQPRAAEARPSPASVFSANQ